ncbi:DUF892 family protein [bacterium]|nr:DUF892 family protein [bacterium]
MASTLTSLRDVLLQELSDLHNAEQQLAELLPRMAEAASSIQLHKALDEHLLICRNHLRRLDHVFRDLAASPDGSNCTAMRGLVIETERLLEAQADAEGIAFDAALIAAAQRICHFLIAAYGSVRTYCQQLCEEKCEELLQASYEDELDSEQLLNALARQEVQRLARGYATAAF